VRGLFVGRFQPLHRGHEEVIKWILGNVDELVVAVGSSNESFTLRNPFTVGERLEMLHATLRDMGILDRVLYCTVPDTGNESAIWFAYVIQHCPLFHVAYTNNEFTRMCLEYGGIRVMGTPIFSKELYSGTGIRRMMIEGDPRWRNYVTKGALAVLERIHAEERLRKIAKDS
jgi:nicotinamide-nucleotide adenylyltransferase